MTYRDDNAEKYLQYIDACGQILMNIRRNKICSADVFRIA